MTTREQHYDFKTKINKLDSQQYINLRVQEIDWALREAEELLIKMIAMPRYNTMLGFESSQRNIDDIRTLVVDNECIDVVDNVVILPEDYWYFVNANVKITKGTCENIKANFNLVQHDDEFEDSIFDNSSFEWREVNGNFFNGGIKLYNDGSFVNNKLCISYIKTPRILHNAQDAPGGTYNLFDLTLTGMVNSELPQHLHREMVDLAVLIKTGELQMPDYNLKSNKLGFNNLINNNK